MNLKTANGRLRAFLICCLAVLIVTALGADLPSQTSSYDYGDRIIHLYVDPIYGEDSTRTAGGLPLVDCADNQNPGPAAPWPCTSLGPGAPQHPTEVFDFNQPGTPPVMLHQPWPYKTITRAVASIPALPKTTVWYDANSNSYEVTWTHAIVHLMPGVYARGTPLDPFPPWTFPGPEVYNVANGLKHNREEFPIKVPRRVSIQGTSSLNTMIDLNYHKDSQSVGLGPAFEFGVTVIVGGTNVPCDGSGSFIDSVTIYGASHAPPTGVTTPRESSAIYIGPSEHIASAPTISNCVFFRNNVGITVAASDEDHQSPTAPVSTMHNGTKIINNTFVWNWTGIWNGQAGTLIGASNSIGWSELIVVNNVFDPYFNGAGYFQGYCNFQPAARAWVGMAAGQGTAFEGVHPDDLHTDLGAGVYWNYNAYEYDPVGIPPTTPPGPNANLARVVFPNGATNPRGGGTLPLTAMVPGVNIAPFTGWNVLAPSTAFHGILFVRDLFCNAAALSTTPSGFLSAGSNPSYDGSPHDFRLAPVATLSSNNMYIPYPPDLTTANSQLNPLVDVGYAGTTILQVNGLTASPPGQLLATTDPYYSLYPYNNWKWDMEGFGNPRIHDHPLYNTGPDDTYLIDIGADEMGELIIAGYRFGTTSFMYAKQSPGPIRLPNNGGNVIPDMDNRYLWYLGPATGTTGGQINPNLILSKASPQLRMLSWYGFAFFPWTYAPANYAQYPTPSSPYPSEVPFYSPPTTASTPNFIPWKFTSKTTGGVCTGPTGVYIPTLADVSPHLQPDLHPWWFMVTAISPTNPIWQVCLSGAYNPLLFSDPSTNRINPPGTYQGGIAGTPTPGIQHLYLDHFPIPTHPSLTRTYFPQFGLLQRFIGLTPSIIDRFTNWNLGHRLSVSNDERTTMLHTMDNNMTGTSELLAVRLSLEQGVGNANEQGGTWSGTLAGNNLQTFMVYVEDKN